MSGASTCRPRLASRSVTGAQVAELLRDPVQQQHGGPLVPGFPVGEAAAVDGDLGHPPIKSRRGTVRVVATHPAAYGKAVWSSVTWRAEAVAWLDERLAGAGMQRTGEVEHLHVRPWATAMRAPTADGPVWMKAAGPATGFYAELQRLVAPYADELVPLGALDMRPAVLPERFEDSMGERASRLRDAYLEGFADLAPHAELVRTLDLARRLGVIAMPARA